MYVPAHFADPDPDRPGALIAAHGFALLVSTGDAGLQATHLPLEYDHAAGRLRGHFARANRHWRDFTTPAPALAIFSGPHAYISPRWYQTGPAVPTWNYEAVHVTGTVSLIEDTDTLMSVMRALSQHYDPSWVMDDLPVDYMEKMRRGVVGFELAITRIEVKRKLNQNRSLGDRLSVIAALEATGTDENAAVAAAMRSVLPA